MVLAGIILVAALVFGWMKLRKNAIPEETKPIPPAVVEAPDFQATAPKPTTEEHPPPVAEVHGSHPPESVPSPEPEIIPEPDPIDPIAWILDHPDLQPVETTLLKATRFPIIRNGKETGSAEVASGSILKVMNVEGKSLTATYRSSGVRRIGIQHTDLRERAVAAIRAAGIDAPIAPMEQVWEEPEPEEDVSEVEGLIASDRKRGRFVHPGLLHNEEDFKRMKAKKAFRPWKGGWEKMVNGRHADLNWKPRPTPVVVRGGPGENYADFYRDIATAYVCAVCWRVTGKKAYAEKSIEILNAWSSTLRELGGNYDKYLAAGIYGYEIANAAEIMRTYVGWKPEDFKRFQEMMLTIFYPMNKHFVDTHGDSPGKIDHFWPNWELCNLASMISIGVLCDERRIYNDAVRYMKRGDGPGAIKVAVYHIHPDGLGQWTEAARDQGHTMMGIGLMSVICEIAWKQGDDLYGYDDNRFLAACEYVAKYNLGGEVPFKKYVNSVQGTFTEPGGGSRGQKRPVWELPYNHYVKRMNLSAPWTAKMAENVRPEGGVGDYGPNSGGYDQLGFGTFTATEVTKKSATRGLR
ncbi:MAG: alginate lyase family protein [Akkermansiaceae bacterium]|nr:alginate lyase family protein [Akkermansiaceae bacterium]